MKIKISAVTDVGKERTNNEDSFVFCPNLSEHEWSLTETDEYLPLDDLGILAIVADGMGGANAGEIASSIAIKVTKECFEGANLSEATQSIDGMREVLFSTINKISTTICNHVIKNPDTIGMGTTIVMVWITKNFSLTAWCGDSRCYFFNEKEGLIRLSKDHSYVQSLIDKGEITEKVALTHEDNSVITRCLGDTDAISEPESKEFDIKGNEMILLCSDGLCGYCLDKEIERLVYKNFTDSVKCKEALLNLAYEKGGQDNITITTISVIRDGETTSQLGKYAYLKKKLKRCLRL